MTVNETGWSRMGGRTRRWIFRLNCGRPGEPERCEPARAFKRSRMAVPLHSSPPSHSHPQVSQLLPLIVHLSSASSSFVSNGTQSMIKLVLGKISLSFACFIPIEDPLELHFSDLKGCSQHPLALRD